MTPPASVPAGRTAPALGRLPWALGAGTVLLEIGYPLVSGRTRDQLTITTVVVFFLASATHALVWRGARWTTLLVAITAGGGLLVEWVGTRTGQPFGQYSYAGTLGAQLGGVPLVIPLAWTMVAYPALLAARRLTSSATLSPLVGGWALAAWDLFLDPQMVDAGHWRWSRVGATLPGVPDVPLSNFAGWLLAAVAMMLVLDRVLPDRRRPADDRLPMALYLWTWASSVLANLAFFGRPAVAAWGGVAMGLVAVPLVISWLRAP
ncbi:MAG: carotenoid biosynthesis protein [Mycobacteriales bacterium]